MGEKTDKNGKKKTIVEDASLDPFSGLHFGITVYGFRFTL
jgi:hypothetical protein